MAVQYTTRVMSHPPRRWRCITLGNGVSRNWLSSCSSLICCHSHRVSHQVCACKLTQGLLPAVEAPDRCPSW